MMNCMRVIQMMVWIYMVKILLILYQQPPNLTLMLNQALMLLDNCRFIANEFGIESKIILCTCEIECHDN